MLNGRFVHTAIMDITLEAQVERGCPQGGVLSPLLWNLVMDELLETLSKNGHKTLGYADDLVIMTPGKYNGIVRDRMQEALNIVTKWTEKEGLKISPSKTTTIVFTKRKNLQDFRPLSLKGEEIKLSGEVKYLGVILDSRLTWTQQLLRIKRRAVTTLMIVKRTHGKIWGSRPNVIHWIYTTVVRPMITYASMVWWTKMQQRNAITELSKVQRLACLGITGAIKTTSTAAMETLLDLPPLQFVIMAEAMMGFFRLEKVPSGPFAELGHNTIKNYVGINILDSKKDHIIPKLTFNKNFQIKIDSEGNLKPDSAKKPGTITWYTDGSKTNQGTGVGIYSEMKNSQFGISLEKHTTVFQAEVYAILHCAKICNTRTYKNRQICIITDSQASLKALQGNKVTSELVWECQKELRTLAEHNKVTLLWVRGHSGIEGNIKADELARKGSSTLYTGPEPALGVTKTTARGHIRNWIKNQHEEYWEKIPKNEHGKTFIKGPSQKKTKELLTLSRNHLRTTVGLLTGHCALKGHLQKMGLYNGDLNCRICSTGTETAYHILCECKAMDHRRQAIYGQPKMRPHEYIDQPATDLYKLVQGTVLLDWLV